MKVANAQIDNYIQKIAQEKIAGCLIFGPETSVVDYRFNLIAKKITPDLSDPFLVSNLSKERLGEDSGILSDEFFSYSMLGGRKLITIKNADTASGAALKILLEDHNFTKTNLGEQNFILIQAGDLDKSSYLRKACEDSANFATIACYEDDERTIKNFISTQLAAKQIKTSPQTISLLLEKLGKNRQIILTELEKIIIFLGDTKELQPELVSKLTSSESEISSNEFVMSFSAQNFEMAFLQAEKLFRDGFEAITLIRFLSNYLQKLYHCKIEIETQNTNFESAVKAQHLFFKTEIEFRKHLKTSSLPFLKEILKKLANLEIKIKNGAIPPKLAFIDFIQSFLRAK
jgi:DNA polymerase-3 subunit delta